MVDFRDVVETLAEIGVIEVLLPFILVYAVVFAILQKSQIFEGGSSTEKQAKSINAVIAAVFGFFTITSIQLIQIFQSFIINSIVVVIFLLCTLIVIGFLLGDEYKTLFNDNRVKYALAILLTIVLLIVLINILGWWDIISSWFDGAGDASDTIITVLVLAGVVGVLFWVSTGGKKGGNEGGNGGKTGGK